MNDMSGMFYGWSSLKELNLSNFNTDNVTFYDYMYYTCSNELEKKIKESKKSLKFK